MRRVGPILLVAVVLLPLGFVFLLLAAARFSTFDAMTMTMPMNLRSTVAAVAMKKDTDAKDSTAMWSRVLKLDPENADAWSARCFNLHKDKRVNRLESCRKAVSFEPTQWNWDQLGLAQMEETKDFCAAEDSFTRANGKANGRWAPALRDMGIAALQCGHGGASVAGFELAESLDEKDSEEDLPEDREWLVLAYTATHQPDKAKEAAAKAHPDWKSCVCRIDGVDGIKCSADEGSPAR